MFYPSFARMSLLIAPLMPVCTTPAQFRSVMIGNKNTETLFQTAIDYIAKASLLTGGAGAGAGLSLGDGTGTVPPLLPLPDCKR